MAALAAWDAIPDETWDSTATKRIDARLDAAQEAMPAHRPATLDEVSRKAAYMAGCRSFFEWDNFDRIKLIEALTPSPTATSPIMTLFQQWNAARDAADRYAEEHEDDEEGFVSLCQKTDDLMIQIAALPPIDAKDFAAKLTYGNYDEMAGDKWGLGSGLIREAAALVDHPEHVANGHQEKSGGQRNG
ncbi:hypothetical protein BPNPMPFG_005635 [Mesorhizobium sp. AR07]|uniref:hypothetical protein n=1 Tax=Mesorhizobium sp. AR07 TaxID=2865838 RepID=UPI00215FF18D|nr:hypothetical protein [Mesorhizobium sp. AR07]UVK43795.1 hypothetical protein BPNPMPFG_005635 [Mesorhizobium sp. AR07]